MFVINPVLKTGSDQIRMISTDKVYAPTRPSYIQILHIPLENSLDMND